MHGGSGHEEMTSLDQQYQLFASSGAIKFPIERVTEAWKEKVCNVSSVRICYNRYHCEYMHLCVDEYSCLRASIILYLYLQIKRLFLLLTTKESAMDVPSNLEARRRISFFSNSLFMDMPDAPKVRNMLSFS